MGRGVNTGALSPVGGIGEIRMRANLRKIVAYKDFAKLYKVLSFHKPQTQIIAVIHNPALIYKLSKLDHVNFIEMTKGYLKKVVSFMNKNK